METVVDVRYIYTLSDPASGGVRYIGQTADPRQRERGHFSYLDPSLRGKWVALLRRAGRRPILKVIETVPASEASAAEKRWINDYLAQGADLLNYQRVPKAQQKDNDRDRRRKRVPEHRKLQHLTVTVRPEHLEYIDRLAAENDAGRSGVIREILDALQQQEEK